jgi:hypothetical protein
MVSSFDDCFDEPGDKKLREFFANGVPFVEMSEVVPTVAGV